MALAPLINPETLQVSAFVDDNPRGLDLLNAIAISPVFRIWRARFDLRPSLWVEAIGGWGSGVVQLVEIPSWSEYHDNVVAFKRPDRPLLAKHQEPVLPIACTGAASHLNGCQYSSGHGTMS